MAKKGEISRSPLALKERGTRVRSTAARGLSATSAKRPAGSQRARHRKAGNGLAGFGSFISTLARSDIRVLKPIPVTFEREEDGSYVASFLDAGVSSGGQTLRDATWSLQEMIAASFQTLRQMSDRELGPKMRRQRDVLLEFLCPSSRKPTPKTPRKS
jgi:predicted RNase H-like HicB family nuclease